MSDIIRQAGKAMSKADQLPDVVRNIVRQLSLKKAESFTGVAGGGKQQVDRVGLIQSHILGGQANRNAVKQAWQQLSREDQATIIKEIGSKYSVSGQPTQITPEGQFIRDYLTGRADLSPEQLRSIAAAEEAAETGAKINPARGTSATFDSNSGTMTDGTETYDLDGGLDGARSTELIDPDLAVPPTPTSTTAQNPYSNLRKSLIERGVIRNKFDTKTPLRVESETNLAPGMVDGEQRMVPVTTTKGGQADRTLTGQTSRAEKGKAVDAATDFQTAAGNSNPQSMYDDRLTRLADGGGGTAEDIWSTLAGPNSASTLRFNFESPREAAEAMVSMLTADIGAARTGGGISAGQIQEMTKGRLYEGFTETDAKSIAQDMGLETSGMGQSRKGLESIIENLEKVITKEVGGSGWGAEARAAAEWAGGAGLPPVPKDTIEAQKVAAATERVSGGVPDTSGVSGKTFDSGESLGDPKPGYEDGKKPKGKAPKVSPPADPLPEVPKKTQSVDAALETVSLEQARRRAWDDQAKGAAMKLGLTPEDAADPPRVIEAQINLLRKSDTPESAQEVARLEALLPNAHRIAAFVEGPYAKRSKQLRYKPNSEGYKTERTLMNGIKSSQDAEELTAWGEHLRSNKTYYVGLIGEDAFRRVIAAGVDLKTNGNLDKKVPVANGLGDRVKARKQPQPEAPKESQPSDLDNAMPEGENITPDPEVVTPDGQTPPKVDPEFTEETIDPYTNGSPARQQPMQGTVDPNENDFKTGRQKGRTRRGRVVDEKPAAGDGGGKKPPEDPPKNNGDNNGGDDWERDYSEPNSNNKKKGKKNKNTPSQTETELPPDPEAGKKKPGYIRKFIGNKWVWAIALGVGAAALNKPGDPNAPTDDVAAFPGGGGGNEISPEVMALAKEALGEGGEEPQESSLIRELRQRKEDRYRRAQALEVNPNVQTNANWRR